MNNASFNYVRTFRKRYALSTDELAFLINHTSHAAISRVETGRNPASLESALALQVLFRQEPREMFPGLSEAVEDGVMRRAKFLLDRLAEKDDRISAAKREFLENLAWYEDRDTDV